MSALFTCIPPEANTGPGKLGAESTRVWEGHAWWREQLEQKQGGRETLS